MYRVFRDGLSFRTSMASLTDVARTSLNRIQEARDELQNSIVNETRNLFRRRRFRRNGETRGRKVQHFKFLSFLLSKANADCVPLLRQRNHLQRYGFGYPAEQLGEDNNKPTPTQLPVTSTLEELEDLLVTLYPTKNLRMAGFRFMKSDQGRRLHEMVVTSVHDLKRN